MTSARDIIGHEHEIFLCFHFVSSVFAPCAEFPFSERVCNDHTRDSHFTFGAASSRRRGVNQAAERFSCRSFAQRSRRPMNVSGPTILFTQARWGVALAKPTSFARSAPKVLPKRERKHDLHRRRHSHPTIRHSCHCRVSLGRNDNEGKQNGDRELSKQRHLPQTRREMAGRQLAGDEDARKGRAKEIG